LGRESRHTPYINRRAACGSSDSLLVKMQCCEGREACKRGVQRDKEGMFGRGVESEGWCPRPLHTMCSPGSLRAIPHSIASHSAACMLPERHRLVTWSPISGVSESVCEAARSRLGMHAHIVPHAGMDAWIGRGGMQWRGCEGKKKNICTHRRSRQLGGTCRWWMAHYSMMSRCREDWSTRCKIMRARNNMERAKWMPPAEKTRRERKTDKCSPSSVECQGPIHLRRAHIDHIHEKIS
jgi:hypothetical protein